MNARTALPIGRTTTVLALLLSGFVLSSVAQPAAQKLDRTQRLRIEGLRQALPEVRITDLAGREVTQDIDPRVEGAAVSVLARQEPLLIRPRQVEKVVLESEKRVVFDGGLAVPVRQPGQATAEKAAWYRLSMTASPLPAIWEADRNEYRTTLAFSLSRPPELPAELPPESPVIIRLSFDGLAAEEPPPITLRKAGLEHEQPLPLHFRVLSENPKILVRSTFTDADLTLRAQPRLELRPQQERLLGFGLEAVNVLVTAVQAHGQPRLAEHDRPVALELSGRARAEPVQPIIPAGTHSTSFQIRSAGLGPLEIRATTEGLRSEATVQQQLPLAPLIATLLGGALGGYARRFSPRARRNLTGRRVLEGTVVGLLAFVAGVLGVGYLRLPPALVTTEAGAFLVAALCGFAGVTVIEKWLHAKRPAEARA